MCRIPGCCPTWRLFMEEACVCLCGGVVLVGGLSQSGGMKPRLQSSRSSHVWSCLVGSGHRAGEPLLSLPFVDEAEVQRRCVTSRSECPRRSWTCDRSSFVSTSLGSWMINRTTSSTTTTAAQLPACLCWVRAREPSPNADSDQRNVKTASIKHPQNVSTYYYWLHSHQDRSKIINTHILSHQWLVWTLL